MERVSNAGCDAPRTRVSAGSARRFAEKAAANAEVDVAAACEGYPGQCEGADTAGVLDETRSIQAWSAEDISQ